MRRMLFIVMLIGACVMPAVARAGPLGTSIPGNCTAHHGWDAGEVDDPGDYRCAGLAVQFHTGGVDRSPGLIWAGQWLFVDADGQYRVGSCTFNRGVHPNVLGTSSPVAQAFPDDPTGAKGAYLAWRYGDATDDLTAAAMWAVMHLYAQDAAGSRRADDPATPLIASLGGIAAMTGRADLQARAEALDAEAVEHSAPWRLELAIGADATVNVAVMSGETPITGATVVLRWDGHDAVSVTTGPDGRAATVLVAEPGTLRLTASTGAPGAVAVYRGPPAEPNPFGAQTLATAGPPAVLTATASVEVPPPVTTVESTTTSTAVPETTVPDTTAPATTAPATTAPATTSTLPATSTSAVPTTEAPTTEVETTLAAVESSTTAPPLRADDNGTTTTAAPPGTSMAGTSTTTTVPSTATTAGGTTTTAVPRLPATGSRTDPPAFVGTALLVGGIGLIGTVRRRTRRTRAPFFDADA